MAYECVSCFMSELDCIAQKEPCCSDCSLSDEWNDEDEEE